MGNLNKKLSVEPVQLLARDSIRILHIEDDNDFAELSSRSLRRAGFNQPVIRCTDGLLALHYFSMIEPQSAPHVILLDLHMPGMDGLEVLHWVRQNYSDQDVAVYLLTSSEDPAHRSQAATDGVTEFLSKNILAEELIQKLDRLIEASNQASQWKQPEPDEATSDSPPQGLTNFSQEPA